jgi:hypothetical protein
MSVKMNPDQVEYFRQMIAEFLYGDLSKDEQIEIAARVGGVISEHVGDWGQLEGYLDPSKAFVAWARWYTSKEVTPPQKQEQVPSSFETVYVTYTQTFQDGSNLSFSADVDVSQADQKAVLLRDAATLLMRGLNYSAEQMKKTPRLWDSGQVTTGTTGDGMHQVQFQVKSLVHNFTDGKHLWKVMGGEFTKFGVAIYEEALKDAGYDLKDGSTLGEVPFVGEAVVLMKGEKPVKVVKLVRS